VIYILTIVLILLKYYTGSTWLTVEATDTSTFASKGFSIAMLHYDKKYTMALFRKLNKEI
jgi:hypothetical protein